MVAFGQNVVEIVIHARDEFSRAFSKASLSIQNFQKAAIGAAAVGVGIAVAFGKAIKTSIDFESAFTGVRKTVDLTEGEFAELEERFKTLSIETGTTFIELSKIGELAGQLGVDGVDNIDKFTRTIADISVTTNLTAEQAATDFARFANVMNMPIDQVDRLGSVVVALGNNLATTEGEIVAMGMRIAGAGKALDMTEGEVMAWSAALSSVGVEAQMGGSAISKLMINISSMVATGSEDLAGFAEVAGMTSEEFSKAFKDDASAALQTFFNGLGKVKEGGGDVLTVLESLDIKEVRLRDTVLRLSSSYGTLNDALGIQGTAWEENTALTEEAEKRYDTMKRQIAKVKAEFAILGDEIGDRLVPFLKDYLIPAIKRVTEWWGNLSPRMKDAILIFMGVTMAVTLLAGAIALVTLVASPWLLIIGAIIIAITAIILVIIHWKTVLIKLIEWTLKAAGFLDNAWETIKDGFVVVWTAMKNVVITVWNFIVTYIESSINAVISLINILIAGINLIPGIRIPLIPKVDFSAIKGQLTDIGVLRTSLQLERETRAEQFAGASQQIMVNIENIYGVDPDDTAEALNETLKDKISI